MKLSYTVIIALLVMFPFYGQSQKITVKPQWETPTKIVRGNDKPILAPSFTDAQYPNLPESSLPVISRQIGLAAGTKEVEVVIDTVSYIPLTSDELLMVDRSTLKSTPEANVSIMLDRGAPVAVVNISPFVIDPQTDTPVKIDFVRFGLKTLSVTADSIANPHRYAKHSRLVYGDWYKLHVTKTGVHKLTFEDMKSMGMKLDGIDPDYINMFGYGGAILEEAAGKGKFDDVEEISIKVITKTPGKFQPGDYILFYGEGPVTWRHNPITNKMHHATHLYTDVISYFITIAPYRGKRMPVAEIEDWPANHATNKYTAVAVYDKDNINIMKSGRKWFSDKFDFYNRVVNLPGFDFPNAIATEPVYCNYSVAARASNASTFNLKINNNIVSTFKVEPYNGDNDFARDNTSYTSFVGASTIMKVEIQFNPPNSTAIGWLDYISMNVRSNLIFRGPQMSFRDPETAGEGFVTNYTMQSTASNLEIWDVTDHSFVHIVPFTRNGNTYTAKLVTPYVREFIAFDGTSFLKPELVGKIPNQDLHAISNVDMIILTPTIFRKEANRLANLHKKKGDVRVKVVSLPEVYNEFSSGHQDITAIRDFMKVLYEKGRADGTPRYLLLFGGTSYDVKNRIMNNSNPIPTYQSHNSILPISSFLTDDYYGLLDDGEGFAPNIVNGMIDIGVGRLPVRTIEQASDAVDKIEAYLFNKYETHGDWRNTILVIADDKDRNLHFDQAQTICNKIETRQPFYNVSKIYFDAYQQLSTPGGRRFPDANKEITSQVDRGALITNYIGHGGELGWADERVLEISDINAWKNFNRMGLFFTATCEFSRFDNPAHTSAGELVFINPNGGAMSMITTTRLAWASVNHQLNVSFIDTAINRDGGIPRLGDIVKYTKNKNTASFNSRHLTLFGDPSLQMPIAKYNVVTTAIVDPMTLLPLDTLSANGNATIHGEVRDLNDEVMNGFNGVVYVKVYDKPTTQRTLGQDAESFQANFKVQRSIIYQGKAKVENGFFNFTFPIPRDINYSYGNGKISYYATDSINEASGYYSDIVIGGSKAIASIDEKGPDIALFINDTNFIDGGLTSENPKLLVKLFDESGINTLSNGVGHDLVGVLDNNQYDSYLLNDFYVADRDTYKSGWARYQFFNLSDGPHSVTVKAHDVFNNPSEAVINFVVKRDIRLDMDELIAYPNPSKGEVKFRFKHNLFDAILKVEVEIYNSTGNLIKTMSNEKVVSDGYSVKEITWDGLSDDGAILRNGLYVCRVRVIDRNGNSSAHSVKVVMAK